jgi:hypothetical protein
MYYRITKLDPIERKKFESLALQRLNATAHHEERWSFAWGSKGAVCLSYCPWSELEDWDFDGTIEGLDLPWGKKRLELISSGEVNPNKNEMRQWREAMCRRLALLGEAFTAWITPVTIDGKIGCYAVFLLHYGAAPEDAPILKGVFSTLHEAKEALTIDGVVISV